MLNPGTEGLTGKVAVVVAEVIECAGVVVIPVVVDTAGQT